MSQVLDDLSWTGPAPAPGAGVLVIAPHPDDEVIAATGLLVWLTDLGVSVDVVAVTDGEASHARSRRITPDELRVLRARERTAALEALGLHPCVVRLGFPDGAVATREPDLERAIAERVGATTTILAPWRHDGHPDHEATGRAAHAAARRTGAALWEVPIWAKVSGRVRLSTAAHRSSLVLPAGLRRRKLDAMRCFASQLEPIGPDPADGPVVHSHELTSMLDGLEEVLWS